MATFDFRAVSFSFDQADGAVTVTRNLEGTAEGYGKVLATVRIHGLPSTSGRWDFVGVNYPESGPRSVCIAEGEWSLLSNLRASTTGTARITTGEDTITAKSQGEFDVAALTWTGTFE
jgi:hypothetical protein